MPFITAFVWPFFDSKPMLQIIFPVALIFGSVTVKIWTKAMCFVTNPLAIIQITVCMIEFTLTMCHILDPVTYVFSFIGPILLSVSVSIISQPLALISSPICELKSIPFFDIYFFPTGSNIWLLLKLGKFFHHFFTWEWIIQHNFTWSQVVLLVVHRIILTLSSLLALWL